MNKNVFEIPSLNQLEAHATKIDTLRTNTPNPADAHQVTNCLFSCSGSCSLACGGDCTGGCGGSCGGNCEGGCVGGCKGGFF